MFYCVGGHLRDLANCMELLATGSLGLLADAPAPTSAPPVGIAVSTSSRLACRTIYRTAAKPVRACCFKHFERCAVQVAPSGSAAAVLAARLHVAHCCATGQLSSLQDDVSRNLQLLRQLLPELEHLHKGTELGSATVDPSVLQSLSAGLGNAGGSLGRLCC